MDKNTEKTSTVEGSVIRTEETQQLALPETTASDAISSAFGGTVRDAEKARTDEASNPWTNSSGSADGGTTSNAAPSGSDNSGATETPSDFGGNDDSEEDEEEKPKKRGKMTPEERAAREQKRHQMRLREAEAYLRFADRMYLGKVAGDLRPLMNDAQLEGVLLNQAMKDSERAELAEPLAEVLEEEDVETSPTTKLMLIAFAIYAPKLEQIKGIKDKLSPAPASK